VTSEARRLTLAPMARMNPAWDPLFARFGQLHAGWPARRWSWDSRFICITSSFTVEFEAQARTAAKAAFPIEYTSATLAKAPPEIKRIAERTGGLRAGQFLLTTTDAPNLTPFGLWWPWGDGATTSFRVGLADLEWNDDPYPRVREIFDVLTG
jgi:hypothetical protein